MPSKVLKRTTYIGRHKLNTKFWKTGERSNHGPNSGRAPTGCGRLLPPCPAQCRTTIELPYKGTGPGITDLLGGHVKMMMPPIPAMIAHINAGALRAIAVTSKERSPLLPDVPTIAEAGLPGFVSEQRYGLLGPAGSRGRSSSG